MNRDSSPISIEVAQRSHSDSAIRHVSREENDMKFVSLVYQGSTPLPGSDRWKALAEAEQKAI